MSPCEQSLQRAQALGQGRMRHGHDIDWQTAGRRWRLPGGAQIGESPCTPSFVLQGMANSHVTGQEAWERTFHFCTYEHHQVRPVVDLAQRGRMPAALLKDMQVTQRGRPVHVVEQSVAAFGKLQDGTHAGDIRVTISIGITLAGGVDDDADALLRRADSAMYQAKNEGRNCIRMILP